MSTILSMLLPAMVASCVIAVALLLSVGAPARWRLAIAAAGLLSWIIPWPILVLPFSLRDATIAAHWVGGIAQTLRFDTSTDAAVTLPLGREIDGLAWKPAALMALIVLPGVLLFVADVVRYRRNVTDWHRQSMDAEHLRSLLPAEVRNVPYAIRIVPHSQIAAATGLLRGTIWMGQGLSRDQDLRTALLHECLHIARKDTLVLLAVTLVKRLYFWNPIIRYFAGTSELFIEAACDEACTCFVGRSEYRESLARLILDSQSPRRIAFGSAMKTGSHDVARVAALGVVPRIHARACISFALCVLGLGAAAALNAQQGADPRIGSWEEARTSTDYQSLRRVFEDLGNGMIRMVVNAKLLEANRWHVDFRCDGEKYRTVRQDGKFTGITYACRRTGARTFETAFTYGEPDAGVARYGIAQDRMTGTWVETVSADGKKYATVGVSRLTNGQTREERRNFIRRE